ncbi:MAG: ABC transporter permease [Pseudohongiellaceae bacterium]
MTGLPLKLARTFLKIFLRDRQAIFFSLFFPIIFMVVFSFTGSQSPDPVTVGVVDNSRGELSSEFIELLDGNAMFEVTRGAEDELRTSLVAGDLTLLLLIPPQFQQTDAPANLTVVVDAGQVQQLGLIMPVLEQTLLTIERELRGTEPLFSFDIEDVRARSQRYLDFLIPGLLAFTLMQLSIAGSGFNLVEFRRKGILKRLFVTPLRPRDFITGIVISRLVICVFQLSILLAVAVLFLDVSIVGSYLSLYSVIILGTIVFLCLGFFLGSLAKTQQSIMAIGNIVIFPQIFLSGIFYPIEALPQLVEPIARILPLSFVATALREIANNGTSLGGVAPELIGILVWLAIGFGLATRYFIWKEVAS